MKMRHLSEPFDMCVCAAIIVLLSLAAAGCSREPQKAAVSPPSVTSEVVATTTVLATIGDDEKPHGGDAVSGHKSGPAHAAQNRPAAFDVVFSEGGGGVAYVAKQGNGFLVVHNDKRGKPYKEINPYFLALSPDGKRVAYGARVDGMWRMVIDGKEEGAYADLGPPVFSPDGRHIAYEAKIGERWHIIVDGKGGPASVSYFDKPAFSGDSAKILYVENAEGARNMQVVVADLEFKKLSVKESSGAQMVINNDKTRVAAVRETGKDGKRVIEFSFAEPDKVKEGPHYDDIAYLTFGGDGLSLAYAALKSGTRNVVLNGREEALPHANLIGVPVILPDQKGIGCIMAGEDGAFLHQAFFQGGTKQKRYEDAADLVYNKDGSLHAYVAKKGDKIFVVVDGKEGPGFDMVIKPLFSPDGRFIVYRARQDGKRFVVVSDAEGKVIKQHPAYEMVFQPVFTADGRSVAYGVKDGRKLIWKVEAMQ